MLYEVITVYFPPSEKESGVVFKIPMIQALGPKSSLKRPNSSVKAVKVKKILRLWFEHKVTHLQLLHVITSYSIHYTKLYEDSRLRARPVEANSPARPA